MLIKTVTTVTALNSAGQLVEALPVRTAVAGETDIVGRPVTPVSVTEDPQGVPVRYVTGKSAVNSAGQVVDSIPVSSGAATPTILRRETDGSVTVVSVANPYTPVLTRQSDGSVIVGAA